MRYKDFTTLTEHVQKLKNSEGYFIIQTTHPNSDKPVFCQLLKPDPNDKVRFEVLSHNFEKSIPPSLENKFSAMGFKLEKGENYVKSIDLNSENNIRVVAMEIVKIFEEIYEVGEECIYIFEGEITE